MWGWGSPSAHARGRGGCARGDPRPCGFGGDVYLSVQRKKVGEQSGLDPPQPQVSFSRRVEASWKAKGVWGVSPLVSGWQRGGVQTTRVRAGFIVPGSSRRWCRCRGPGGSVYPPSTHGPDPELNAATSSENPVPAGAREGASGPGHPTSTVGGWVTPPLLAVLPPGWKSLPAAPWGRQGLGVPPHARGRGSVSATSWVPKELSVTPWPGACCPLLAASHLGWSQAVGSWGWRRGWGVWRGGLKFTSPLPTPRLAGSGGDRV